MLAFARILRILHAQAAGHSLCAFQQSQLRQFAAASSEKRVQHASIISFGTPRIVIMGMRESALADFEIG